MPKTIISPAHLGPPLAACMALILASASTGRSQDLGQFIEVRPGNLPIILTAPHGGTLKPDGMKARTFGSLAQDSNTAEVTELLSQELERLYQARPHIVFCRLHRSKIDCNRELEEAAQGDPVAVAAWKRFHGAAATMRQQITRQHGAGLLLDIHGHRHEEARVELGYLISGIQLGLPNDALDADPKLAEQSSIRELVMRSPQSFSQLLRGPQSLGALLEHKAIPAIPSPANFAPGKAAYYSGAYDVTAHGSRNGGTISAIQIECPWQGVRDTPVNQKRFVRILAEALGEYFKAHFGMGLGGGRPQRG